MTNDDIQLRIPELQGEAGQKISIMVESLATELEEVRQAAIRESVVRRFIMGKAKLVGLGIERKKIRGTLQVKTLASNKWKRR